MHNKYHYVDSRQKMEFIDAMAEDWTVWGEIWGKHKIMVSSFGLYEVNENRKKAEVEGWEKNIEDGSGSGVCDGGYLPIF